MATSDAYSHHMDGYIDTSTPGREVISVAVLILAAGLLLALLKRAGFRAVVAAGRA